MGLLKPPTSLEPENFQPKHTPLGKSQSVPLPRHRGPQLRRAITRRSLLIPRKSYIFRGSIDIHHELLESSTQASTENKWHDLKYQFKHIGQNTWRFSLFKNSYFVMYLIATILWVGTYYTPFTFLPDRAKLMGIGSRDSSLLISVIGISSIVGRVMFGVICDIPAVQPYRIYFFAASFIITGLALALTFVASLAAQMVTAAVYGLFLGK